MLGELDRRAGRGGASAPAPTGATARWIRPSASWSRSWSRSRTRSPRRPSGAAPHRIAAYALELAQEFTAFYRDCKVVGAQPAAVESFRIALSQCGQADDRAGARAARGQRAGLDVARQALADTDATACRARSSSSRRASAASSSGPAGSGVDAAARDLRRHQRGTSRPGSRSDDQEQPAGSRRSAG